MLFTTLLQNMCQQQICPSNAWNMPHAQIPQHAFMGEVCQYTYHIWSYSHQWCSQNCCIHDTGKQWSQWWFRMMTMMMPQPKYIYWFAHWDKSVKKNVMLIYHATAIYVPAKIYPQMPYDQITPWDQQLWFFSHGHFELKSVGNQYCRVNIGE